MKQNIEYHTYIHETNHKFNDIKLNWPFEQLENNKCIVAYNQCLYPISLEEHLIEELRNENNVIFATVIPIQKLFKKVGIAYHKR